MGDERTNEVFIDDVFVPDEYVVGEVNRGFQYITPGARPRALHDVHVRAHRAAPRPAHRVRPDRDARRRAAAATTRSWRSQLARLVTEAEVAPSDRPGGGRRAEEGAGTPRPTIVPAQSKLFATEFFQRLANASMDIAGPGTQLRVRRPSVPMEGRARVDVPLHRDRHDRRRSVGDPEERDRPPGLGLPKNF